MANLSADQFRAAADAQAVSEQQEQVDLDSEQVINAGPANAPARNAKLIADSGRLRDLLALSAKDERDVEADIAANEDEEYEEFLIRELALAPKPEELVFV